jgi:ribosome recycling factor
MDVNNVYAEFKQRAQKSIDFTTNELRHIRTGQISPALVEELPVTAYGGTTTMRLLELASINTEGPVTLVISPFDASIVQDIERAIHASPLGLSPRVEGKIIRITTPPLTEEQREKYVKLANQKVEEGKVHIRNHRDEARKHIKALHDDKAISEDDKFRAEKEIDVLAKDFTDKLEDLRHRKQEEILRI